MHVNDLCICYVLTQCMFMFLCSGCYFARLTAAVCWSRPLHPRYEGWGRENIGVPHNDNDVDDATMIDDHMVQMVNGVYECFNTNPYVNSENG